MKEVKTPKKPLAYYYGIVLIVLIVFNLVVTPILMEHQVKETDYGTFMSMIEKKNIGEDRKSTRLTPVTSGARMPSSA